jgi:tetratricopeptide (TPR) repeat protein
MKMRRHLIISVLAAALPILGCVGIVCADAVVLKDGSRVEGDVKRTEAGWTVTGPDGKTTDVSADDVQTIEVGGGKSSAASAASNLASLRRSTEAMSSPALAIERYQRFLDQSKGTPSYEDGKKDLAVWQDRLDRGLVKVGTQWVTPAQKGQMASQANGIAQQAVDLLKQGRAQEAAPIIQQALDADPSNPAALYLRGLNFFDTNDIVSARKSFEAVIAELSQHAPSLNNLAVIFLKQNQQMGAIRYYELAMIAAPVNKIILDNVAEALHDVPADQRSNPLAVRVAKRFAEQDAELQQVMAQQGLHRWGSTWVDQPTLDKLNAAEQQVKDKLDALTTEIETARSRIAQINIEINANTQSMNTMAATNYYRDAKGNLIQGQLPGQYYDLQADNEKLTGERAADETDIQSKIAEGKRIQQSLPVPPYTGQQHVIGIEGAPFPPATQPTTAPAAVGAPSSPPTAAPGLPPPVVMPLP